MSFMIVVRDQSVSYIKVLCFCVDLGVDILYLGIIYSQHHRAHCLPCMCAQSECYILVPPLGGFC